MAVIEDPPVQRMQQKHLENGGEQELWPMFLLICFVYALFMLQ